MQFKEKLVVAVAEAELDPGLGGGAQQATNQDLKDIADFVPLYKAAISFSSHHHHLSVGWVGALGEVNLLFLFQGVHARNIYGLGKGSNPSHSGWVRVIKSFVTW